MSTKERYSRFAHIDVSSRVARFIMVNTHRLNEANNRIVYRGLIWDTEGLIRSSDTPNHVAVIGVYSSTTTATTGATP